MFNTLFKKAVLAIVTTGMLVSTTAQAATTFQFNNPGIDAGVVGGEIPVGGDSYGNPITFLKDGIGISATANGANSVYWDKVPNLGGLGVHNMAIPVGSLDSIQAGEILTLTFNTAVRILDVRFTDTNHLGFLTNEGAVSYTTQPGGIVTQAAFGNLAAPTIIQPVNSISFANPGGQYGVDFYLASITVEAIPEPSTYLLLGSTLCLVSLARSRKKNRATA